MMDINYLKKQIMKLLYKNLKNIRILISLSLILSLINACKKEEVSREVFQSANLMVVNTFPVNPAVPIDFLLNDVKLNTRALAYPPVAADLTYMVVTAGEKKITFQRTTSPFSKIDSILVNLQEGKNYSVFLAGTLAAPRTVFITDSLRQPSQGKALIRFVNLSPNFTSGDLGLRDDTPPVPSPARPVNKIITAQASNAASDFVEVNAGTYTAQAFEFNSNTSRSSLGNISLLPNQSYTIIARGVLGGSPGLTLQLIQSRVY